MFEDNLFDFFTDDLSNEEIYVYSDVCDDEFAINFDVVSIYEFDENDLEIEEPIVF